MSDTDPRSGAARSRDAGGQVLVWMRDEFEALRRQVHALAASVSQQRAMLSELGGSRVAELSTSLAELEGCAAALRNEAARLQSIEHSLGDRLAVVVSEAVAQQVGEVSLKGIETLLQDRLTDVVADAVRPQLRAAIAARLPEIVNDVVQPQVKAALADIQGCTTELREEYARLRALRDDLMVRFPRLVETSVERVLERHAGALAPPSPAGFASGALDAPGAPTPAAATTVAAPVSPPPASAPPGPPPASVPAGPTVPVSSTPTPAPPTPPTPADPVPSLPVAQSAPVPTMPVQPAAAVAPPVAPAPAATPGPPGFPSTAANPAAPPSATAPPPAVPPPAAAPPAAAAANPAAPPPAAPTLAGPAASAPTSAAPTQVAPTQAGPTQVAPTQAGPTQVAPTPAGPAAFAPTQAGPAAFAPTPAGPTATAPTPADPTQAGPAAPPAAQAGPATSEFPSALPAQPAVAPSGGGGPAPAPPSESVASAAGSTAPPAPVSSAPPGGGFSGPGVSTNGPGQAVVSPSSAGADPRPTAPGIAAAADLAAAAIDAPGPIAVEAADPVPATGVRLAETPEASADIAVGIACVLPGMVVGPSLAVGVAEALGRARLRRRRRRRAAPPAAGLYRRDPFAGHVTRRLERFARGRPAAPPTPGRSLGVAGWASVVVGELDGEEVAVDLATAGLVLDGPQGADVVRAAVTGMLCAHGPSTMAAVVVGDLLPAVPPFPGLAQTALGPAIDELTAEVGRRLRLLADDDVPDAGAYRAKHPDADFPMILLAAAGIGPDDLARVRALFQEGARAGVSGIVVVGRGAGELADLRLAPGAVVAEVRSATLAEPRAGARLFQLEPGVAAELLAVLASARTDGEHMRAKPDDDESFVPATSAATAPVAVQLLGVYRIEVDGTEIKSGLRAKARELLAFYLLHPEGATLDDAVEALWPEADPRRGSEWFWTALGNLRTKLRQATGQKELKVIDRDGDLYRIEDVFDVDLWSLQHALKEGARSRDDTVRQAALDRAVADYDGDLLVGLDWFWLDTPREDLRQRMVDVLVWLGDRRWASGDARAAWAALQRALEVDPYAEQIYRRIMRLQAKLSRPDDAEATYRRLVAKLQEVDLQPTPESEKLHAEVCPQH